MKVNGEFGREFALIVVGVIVLTTSLMWKDVIMEVENELFPESNGLFNRIFFTIVLTLVFVILLVYMRRYFKVKQPE
jgi:hypothetical protein